MELMNGLKLHLSLIEKIKESISTRKKNWNQQKLMIGSGNCFESHFLAQILTFLQQECSSNSRYKRRQNTWIFENVLG
jgi:hypothetical protein